MNVVNITLFLFLPFILISCGKKNYVYLEKREGVKVHEGAIWDGYEWEEEKEREEGKDAPPVGLIEDKRGRIVCSGIMVDDTHFLTAAHCLERKKLKGLTLKVRTDETHQVCMIQKAFNHQLFDKKNRPMNDIALIKVRCPLQVKEFPALEEEVSEENENNVRLFGYGSNRYGETKFLQYVDGTLHEVNEGERFFHSPNGDAAGGDSGGPLLIWQNGIWVLKGIYSRGLDPVPGRGGYITIFRWDDFSRRDRF